MAKTKVVDMQMFSTKGNRAAMNVVKTVCKKIEQKRRWTENELEQMVLGLVIEARKEHGEITDTEPRWEILSRINRTLDNTGYGFKLDNYLF